MVDVRKLAKIGNAKKICADEIFFHQGDLGQEMFILLLGKVGVFANSIDGYPTKLAELGPGSFFGEMSLLEQQPRTATVQALEDCVAIALNQDNFEQVISQQPQLAFRIMQGMSQRIRQQNEEIVSLKSRLEPPSESSEDHQSLQTSDCEKQAPEMIELPKKENNPNLTMQVSSTTKVLPEDDKFLFDKETPCPVCGGTFSIKMLRSSRLRLERVDPDLRQRFHDVEPLWYMVWVCPHCSYANFNYEFKQINDEDKKYILSNQQKRKNDYSTSFSTPRRLGEVLQAYYLVLDLLMNKEKPDSGRVAKVWLRLSWLYGDANDQENCQLASKQALEYFKQLYYNDGARDSLDQEQRLALLLGELSMRIGALEDAGVFLRKAIIRRGGNATINRQAENRIQDLKTQVEQL